jgi:D-alanyl-lipoteichoic acid acyltransferase DltB (MBOAT superfamily)
MLFNSAEFIIFFPIVVLLYFALPHKWRWGLLLTASYYFYMCWKAEYIILIIASTFIDYFAGHRMGQLKEKARRRKYLLLSLCTNLGLLFAFKYFNFFNESTRAIFNQFNLFYSVPAFSVLLPVGISFYTFQTLSYSIDVYRGNREPEKHLGVFALYVAFFPQLVAGPIERSTHLIPQFFEKHDFDYHRVTNGLKRMAWGLFKKVVIADRLALYVNQVYNNPTEYSGAHIWIATYFFAFQIFCDFSGYSDIAIGAAQVMGYRFMENFRRPYLAQNISEFWKRWHISLSTWFRDYLYIPLGGNRVGKWRWYYNLFIVFLISGLWHGANWTFIIWGALHGFHLIFSIVSAKTREQLASWCRLDSFPVAHAYLKRIITFHLVCFAWIFFRANSVGDAFILIKNLFHFESFSNIPLALGDSGMRIALLTILLMEIFHYTQEKISITRLVSRQHLAVRWTCYYALLLGIIIFGVFEESAFIYFQF